MMTLYHRKISNQLGAVMLLLAVVLMVLSTLIIIFAANYGQVLDQTIANQTRNNQAFQAAQGGMEFGINYLRENAQTIMASESSGSINYSDASTTNITFTNGSKFSVVYTNPTVNIFNVIQITSTGASDDNTATRIVRQRVKLGALLANPGTYTLVGRGTVTMSNRSELTNTSTDQNIRAGGNVSITGSNAHTTTSTGTTSDNTGFGADILENVSALASLSGTDFFASYFGTTNTSTIQGQMDHVYSNNSGTSYQNTINNMQNTSIWITQGGTSTATIGGTNTNIGTASNPVLLIVNGRLTMQGTVNFYGFIFVLATSGTTNISGNVNIVGGIAIANTMAIAGNANITYDPTVLANLQANDNARYYAKIPGSWRDF